MKNPVAVRRDESRLYKGRTARSFGGLRMTLMRVWPRDHKDRGAFAHDLQN
jgi:hypothetical protein